MATNNTPIDKKLFTKLKEDIKKNRERPRKKFPKVTLDAELPPKKGKKNGLENEYGVTAPPPFSLTVSYEVIEKALGAQSPTVQQIAMPIVSHIKLMKDRGITKTHFLIESKTFGEIEVSLTMYDTAPHSFHLQMYGAKKLQEISMQQQSILKHNIESNVPKIVLHMAPPLLRKRDRFTSPSKKKIAQSKTPLYSKVDGSTQL
ncbi:hypothetical protein K0U07_01420 [bacterium]|nr:hypothetical protein [bacterium]